jgi:outer membrane protein OmpA-like peptidoglycan-associated protein
MRSIFFFFFLISGIFVSAQNLVLNPGFEATNFYGFFGNDSCWYKPTSGSTDIINTKVHLNLDGLGGACIVDSGNCFAGFIACGSYTDRNYREYLGGSLSTTLEEGKTYTVSFSIQLGNICQIGVENLGIFFSKTKKVQSLTSFDQASFKALPDKPQLIIDLPKAKNMSGKWTRITANYVATGEEKYFILGNFSNNLKTKIDVVKLTNQQSYAYYYVDDFLIQVEKGKDENFSDTVEATEENISMTDPIAKDTIIAAGKTLVANNILFETNKSELLPASFPPLYKILAALKEQPNLKVEIDGHTDNIGKTQTNQKLSEDRAKAVADFLLDNGIDADRITWKGFGSSKPISTDNDKNRRVEFIFSD